MKVCNKMAKKCFFVSVLSKFGTQQIIISTLPRKQNIGILQKKWEILKHRFLVSTGSSTEVTQKTTTGYDHFMWSILFFRYYFSFSTWSLNLRLCLSIRLSLSSSSCWFLKYEINLQKKFCKNLLGYFYFTQSIHHDSHDVLVNSKDSHQVWMLKERVIVNHFP